MLQIDSRCRRNRHTKFARTMRSKYCRPKNNESARTLGRCQAHERIALQTSIFVSCVQHAVSLIRLLV